MTHLSDEVLAYLKDLRDEGELSDEQLKRAVEYLNTQLGIEDMSRLHAEGARLESAVELTLYVIGETS